MTETATSSNPPGTSTAPESTVWRAIHVYYYDERKEDLLLRAVQPLIRTLEKHVERIYFVRHWRRGPHIRIAIRATPSVFVSHVEPAATRIIGSYLAEQPSLASLPSEDKLLPMHRRLADMEEERGELRPLVSDNTMIFEEHDRRLKALGGEAGADLLSDFFHATNGLVFRMLERIQEGRSREMLSLPLMVAVAHCFSGNSPTIRQGFVSFRSHAEAFLHSSSDPERIRASFDRQYAINRAVLTGLVRGVIDTLITDTAVVPFVSEWVSALHPFWVRAAALIQSGELMLSEPDERAGATGASPLAQVSPMHRLMANSSSFRTLIFQTEEFKRYRLMLSYTYLHMARLGVMGYGRFRLCHLAANAVEDTLGINGIDIVRRLAGAPPFA